MHLPREEREAGRSQRAGRGKTRCIAPLLAVWIAAVGLAPAQEASPRRIIRKISIQGLQRESEATLRANLGIRIGDVYEPQKVSLETGKLYATKKFSRVDQPIVTELDDGVAITFKVEERPLVRALEIVGRKALSEGKIRADLETRVGGLFSDASLQRDRETITDKYLEAGHLFVRVAADKRAGPDGVRVTFTIEEGTRVRIREVKFVGNRAFSGGALLGVMETRERDFWLFGLLRPGLYDHTILEADLKNIENYYARHGFFDARAELQEVALDDQKERATITIRIQEGPQYIFRGYRFARNAVFADKTLLDLTRAIPGQPFNADVLRQDEQEIKNYYGDRAYIFAEVASRPEVALEGNDVHIRFEIDEGNEIFIEEVKIQGNEKTQDRVVRRELEFYPGERVDRSKLAKSRSNLNRLQIFKNVSYSYEPGSSPSDRDIVVKIEEESSGRLILGFGVTSGFGVIGNFTIVKRNFDPFDLPDSFYDIPESFTGAGMTLNLQAQPGTQRSLYRFTLIEPYLFETRNALSLSASKLTLIRNDYDEDRASFNPSLSHAFDFDRDFVFSLGTRLEEVEISDIESDAAADVFAVEGFTTIIAANTGVRLDKRLYEYLEGSYDGTLYALEYEYAGGVLGGDVDFHKIEATNEWYYPLYTFGSGPATMHHILSLANRFGVIEPHDDTDEIPIFERFFLGGPNTVRGFKFRRLGPHDGNDPIGGTATLWGNVEYSFPIFIKILRGVVFFDYGNLEPDLESFSFGNMRYTVGGGIRVNFPFLGTPLPIGLYFGVPLHEEDDDSTQVFSFTIGTPF
jgi:outer membrane protein insertion porin family